jgi:anti-sigma B factor antagonist
MSMKSSTRQVGDVTVVDISGRIVIGEESAALRELIHDLISHRHNKILLNLRDVQYIDSSGLGSLVGAFTSVRKQHGELKLLHLTGAVQNVMQVTKLYTVFDIMNDEMVAIKSFGQSSAAAV